MARPTKHAPTICLALTALVALGVVIAFLSREPLWLVAALLPTTGYQVYRTEGESTTWASWVLLVTLVIEGLLLIAGIDVDLAVLMGRSSQTVAGYDVPLGPVTVVGPLLMGILAVILIVRTRGRFTRWLAAIILVGSGALIYILDPLVFAHWLEVGLDPALRQIR